MSVFVLLTLKYAEVSARFPEGGGVVTVAAQAINSWVGALGGMFILVSYFLTAAISCLAAIQYFSVVFPAINPLILEITIGVLVLLGLLNWVGISEIAKVMRVVHSAIQRALRLSASLSPRITMMNSAPTSGRKVVTERIGQLIVSPDARRT